MRYESFSTVLTRRRLLVLREIFLHGRRQAELVAPGYSKSSVSLDKKFVEKCLGELQVVFVPEDIRFVADEFERALHELLGD